MNFEIYPIPDNEQTAVVPTLVDNRPEAIQAAIAQWKKSCAFSFSKIVKKTGCKIEVQVA